MLLPIYKVEIEVSNGRVELKLDILKWVVIEIELGLDPPKFTLDSNELKHELGLKSLTCFMLMLNLLRVE